MANKAPFSPNITPATHDSVQFGFLGLGPSYLSVDHGYQIVRKLAAGRFLMLERGLGVVGKQRSSLMLKLSQMQSPNGTMC